MNEYGAATAAEAGDFPGYLDQKRGWAYYLWQTSPYIPIPPDIPRSSASSQNELLSTSTGTGTNPPVTEGVPATIVLMGFPYNPDDPDPDDYTATLTPWTMDGDSSISVSFTDVEVISNGIAPPGDAGLVVQGTATFPTAGLYQGYIQVYDQGKLWTGGPGNLWSGTVLDAPWTVTPVNFSVPANGGEYDGPVATVQDSDPGGDTNFSAGISATGQVNSYSIVKGSGGDATVNADITFPPQQQPSVYIVIMPDDNEEQFHIYDYPTPITSSQPQFTSLVVTAKLMSNGSQPADPPLAIIDTTDPTITSTSQVSVSVGTPSSANTPIPLVTGTTLTHLSGGMTQIAVNGVVSAVQPGAGPAAAAPLNIAVGNEPPLTAQVVVNQTPSEYVVNPANVVAVAGQPVQNVQVATLSGPANGSYSATINWGDGDTSPGIITALGGGQFTVTGSKPHPYATAGTDTITVTVNGPGSIPAPAAQTLATVTSSVSPPPSPAPSPPLSPPSPPPAPPPSPPTPPPSPPLANSSPPPVSPLDQIFIEFEQIVAEIEAEIEQFIDTELAIISSLLSTAPKV